MNRITTLRSLTAPAQSPETLAATLRQLARIIHQTSDAPLPTGTSVDWPLPEALSAAARLDGDDSGAFRGHGRVLGPMYTVNGQEEESTPRRYNLRSRRGMPGRSSRFASASSMAVRRGSTDIEEVEAEAELEIETEDGSEWADDEHDEDEDEDDGDGDDTTTRTGTVMRDETQSGMSPSFCRSRTG